MNKEAIIVIVGFLGSGKTTLLKRLVDHYVKELWNPYIILNDYENAQVDAQHFLQQIDKKFVDAISGSCICCDGINKLRNSVNSIPERQKAITFIEANGSSDAYSLMGFLGVGLKQQFLPPIQVAVVDVRNWQKRGRENELEANQVQVSSMVVLNYADKVDTDRLLQVKAEIKELNSFAKLTPWNDLEDDILPQLDVAVNPKAHKLKNLRCTWSSCSVDLIDPMESSKLDALIESIPASVLRIKGATRLDGDSQYTFFERIPSGEVFKRPFYGKLVSGPKLLLIGPGSDPKSIEEEIQRITGI